MSRQHMNRQHKNRQQLQPYPGLRPFERRESRIFFGRQKQVDELLQRLKEQHFLAVLGASGSGKSSLVKAGMLAGLEKGYMGEIGASWKMAECRPGDQPFERLADSLAGQDKAAWLAAQLRRGSRSLHDYLHQSPLDKGQKLLILVDQFEEIFRYRQQSSQQAAAFVALLLEASRHDDIYVVITMRSDFLGEAAAFHGLPEAINDGLYLTPRLTREQLQEAIALPAQLFGGEVDEALINQLLNEAGNNPDQLPLLQHALMRLWLEDEDKRLTLPEYRELDGLSGALDGHLEQVYNSLENERQQGIAQTLFRSLTQRETDGQDVRRPVSVSDVLDLLNAPFTEQLATPPDQPSPDSTLDELNRVVDAFRGEGRHFLVASTPELASDSVLDISHESLIRQWRRLQGWVDEEAAKVELYHRLSDAAQRRNSEQGGELWRGTDLALAQDWQQQHQPNAIWAQRYDEQAESFTQAMDFLATSEAAEQQRLQKIEEQQQQERERQQAEIRRSRRQLAFALIGLFIAVGLAVWGAIERTRANHQTQAAVEAAERAEKQKEHAEKQKQRADAESTRAQQSEQERSKELFNANTTHAGLLGRMDNSMTGKPLV